MAAATEPSRNTIPVYDRSRTKWLEFVVKFKDLVHDLQCLTERMTYLLQHLEGKAKRAVQYFSSDKVGYIMALKRLKYVWSETSDKPGIKKSKSKLSSGKTIYYIKKYFQL